MEAKILPKLPYTIYYINLDRRPDRKIKMEYILQNNTYVRISAVDCNQNFIPYNVITHYRLKPGENGCTCSHIIALYTYLINSNDEYAFIAEDDVEDIYSKYWKTYHYELLLNGNHDILQMQTTSDKYDNKSMTEILMSESGATFYKIKRNIAQKIVDTFYNKNANTINLTLHYYPVADKLLWDYGKVYMIPMISYVNCKDSETSPDNIFMNNEWFIYFNNAKVKYLSYWKTLEQDL